MSAPTVRQLNESGTAGVAGHGLSVQDFLLLTKARLSALVVVTTAAGYWLAAGADFLTWRMVHTVFGTTMAAFGAAVFNQLMEMDADARMMRTAGRPLPGRRLAPAGAFVLGWVMSGLGIIHLGVKANTEAAALALLTLLVYLFVYTPMKTRSTLNTVAGAVSGALPPVIGWVAAAGEMPLSPGLLRWGLLIEPQALYLFSLLFLWQMPHFIAINWMYRAEYIRGGFVMWSNTDESGRATSIRALCWSLLLLPLCFWPSGAGFASWYFTLPALAVTLYLLYFAVRFVRTRNRSDARKLFLVTLLYLPVMLAALLVFARH